MAITEKGIYYPTDYTKVADVPADFKQLAESADKAIGNIPEYDDTSVKEDINKLKENDEQQDKDMENLKTELETEIEELNQDIQANAIIQETEKAKSLYIDDASGARGSLSVEGNNEQDTREGYNLIDIINSSLLNQDKGVSIEIEDDGYIIASGTPTSSYIVFIRKNINNLIEDGKTYSIWQEKYGSTSASRIYAQVLASPKEGSGASQKYYQAGNKRMTFVADKENYDYSWMIQASTISEAGTFNNYKNRYMIYEGNEDKNFELYGVMPSPQYRSEIKVLEAGSTEIKKTGKNIMPILNLGTNWEYTDKGIKNLKANVGSTITRINLKKGQTVKIGFKVLNKPTGSISFTGYVDNTENGNISFYGFNNFTLNQVYEKIYTALKDCTLKFTLWGNDNNEIFEFQLWAEFDTLTDYEQYKEETFNLDIQQDMLKGDCFIKEEDGWKEVHLRSKRDIKDDITNATLSGTNNFIYVSKLLQNTAKLVQNTEDANVISNIAQHESYSNISAGNIDYGIGISNVGSLIIRIKDCTTLEEYKDVLNDDSFYYYYYLATPTKLVCTDAQIEVLEKLNKLRYYEGVNNIFTTEDIALLQAKYPVNLQTKLNNINAQLLELGGN